ncbi:MAG: squalene/phytoene synthase family protein [Natronomonas sp.]
MTGSPGDPTLDVDRRWALDAVESVSRTFALTVDLLEEPVASWVCTGYLLCRAADTIEDDPSIPPKARAELLETYESALDPETDVTIDEFLSEVELHRPEELNDDWEALVRTDRTMRVFESFDPPVREAMRGLVREMSTGMASFLRRHAEHGGLRIETVDELEEYCWYVAGTVGELFTGLVWQFDERAADADPDDAEAFALLLQLVNIAKDVRVDYETEGNVYLPGEWLTEEGIDHSAVGDPEATEALTRVVRRVADHAESHAPGARRYLETLPAGEGNVLESMALPYLLALGTLRELRGRAEESVTKRDTVKLARAEVEALYARADDGLTHAELDRLAEIVRQRPYHESV